MFFIRVIWKVGMKWATIEEKEGVNILMKYVCCVTWRLHIQIHTLFAVGPTKKGNKAFKVNLKLIKGNY